MGAHGYRPEGPDTGEAGSGGDPPLDDVIRMGQGGYLHQLVEAPPGVLRAFQNPELTCAGGRVVVGGVWWEVRWGEGEKRSLYVGWEPLAGTPDGGVSDVPQCDQSALLESTKVALARARGNVGGDRDERARGEFSFLEQDGGGDARQDPKATTPRGGARGKAESGGLAGYHWNPAIPCRPVQQPMHRLGRVVIVGERSLSHAPFTGVDVGGEPGQAEAPHTWR